LIINKCRGIGAFSIASASLVIFISENLSLIFNLVVLGAELLCQKDISNRQHTGDHPDVPPQEVDDFEKSVPVEEQKVLKKF